MRQKLINYISEMDKQKMTNKEHQLLDALKQTNVKDPEITNKNEEEKAVSGEIQEQPEFQDKELKVPPKAVDDNQEEEISKKSSQDVKSKRN